MSTSDLAIRAVAFDLMDTVLVDPFRRALTGATGRSVEELFAVRDPDAYPAFERAEIDEQAYWDTYRERGVEVDPAAFHAVRRGGIRFVDGMGKLLDDLEGLVVRATASNYPVWIRELEATVLDGRFELVVASHDLGVRKPDPAFFERLTAMLDCPPEQVAFVDDRRANVEAAAAFGMPSRRFDSARDLEVWLGELGVVTRARGR